MRVLNELLPCSCKAGATEEELNEVAALAMTVGSMKIRLLFDDLAQSRKEGVPESSSGKCAPEATLAADPTATKTRFT